MLIFFTRNVIQNSCDILTYMATNISEDFVSLLSIVVQNLRYQIFLTYSISQNKLDSTYNMVTVYYHVYVG